MRRLRAWRNQAPAESTPIATPIVTPIVAEAIKPAPEARNGADASTVEHQELVAGR